MEVDRDLQRNILLDLKKRYPQRVAKSNYHELVGYDDIMKPKTRLHLDGNIRYLEGHGLVELSEAPSKRGILRNRNKMSITPKGIDFLEDDGGLSTILNTVTVKFDVESTRKLLTSGLLSMGVPEEKEGILRSAIKGATTDTIKELMESVLKNPMGAINAARNLLGVVF